MNRFWAGFLCCYLLGALPMGVIVYRMHGEPFWAAYNAAAWPSVMSKVAAIAIIKTSSEPRR